LGVAPRRCINLVRAALLVLSGISLQTSLAFNGNTSPKRGSDGVRKNRAYRLGRLASSRSVVRQRSRGACLGRRLAPAIRSPTKRASAESRYRCRRATSCSLLATDRSFASCAWSTVKPHAEDLKSITCSIQRADHGGIKIVMVPFTANAQPVCHSWPRGMYSPRLQPWWI
jgi:hypothetical protein